MLSDDTRAKIASQIFECFKTKSQIGLLSTEYPDLEVEDSYRIQEQVVAKFLAEGRTIKGYKVGLTSKPMQEMAGTYEPDYSAMLDDMFYPESSEIDAGTWMTPLVEIEIAFVMKESLKGPGVNAADVIRATDFILPAIEVVDFRVARAPGMGVSDTIADLAAVGGVILGGNPVSLNDLDVREIGGTMAINGEVLEQGTARAVLGNPVNAIAWLANKMSEFDIAFKPGDVILSGSFLRALPIKQGDEIVARFDHGLGDVSFSLR